MAFRIKATLQALHSHFAKSGYFPHVQIGEPKQPIGEKLGVAIFPVSMSNTVMFGGGKPRELHVVTCRIYKDMLEDPEDQIEFAITEAVAEAASNIIGDFDLESTVNHVDICGQYGTPLSVTFGYLTLSNVMYRLVDITVPIIVDDSTTAAA